MKMFEVFGSQKRQKKEKFFVLFMMNLIKLLITQAAVKSTNNIRRVLDIGCGAWLEARPDMQNWRVGEEFDVWHGDFQDLNDEIEQAS